MLRQANCIKRTADGTKVSLHADAGESFLVKNVIFGHTDTSGYPVFRVDRKTVGCYRGGVAGLSHLGHLDDTYIVNNLMEWLMSKGINVTIPVAEGQTFTVERTGDTGDVTIVYDIYDAADIRADMENGSDAKEYNFIQYMTADAALDEDGDHELNTSLSPAEFPDFPCGKVVPARTTIDVLGIAGQPVSEKGVTGGYTTSQYLKLIKDREILFDEDRDGIPFMSPNSASTTAEYITDESLVGDCVAVGASLSNPSYGFPLLFDPPLHFESGEELLVKLHVNWATDGSLDVNDVRVALILHVKVD